MVDFHDVDRQKLSQKLAAQLEQVENIKAPEWSAYAKTGVHKKRPPVQRNWWHLRAAAVLATVADLGPVGVNKLRVKYGGRKRRGYAPPEFRKGSGNVIRKVLQQLESAKLIEQKTIENHKGRVITGAGRKLLAKASKEAQA